MLSATIKRNKLSLIGYIFSFSVLVLSSCRNDSGSDTTKTNPIAKDTIAVNAPLSEATSGYTFDSTQYEWQDGYLKLPWSELTKLDFKKVFDDSVGTEIDYPIFSDTLKALDSRKVLVSGYIIPLEETGDETIIILSAFPYSQCFFCGLAGPESVMDILPKNKLKRLKMDTQITLKGRLRLNDTDLRYLYYILDDAELE